MPKLSVPLSCRPYCSLCLAESRAQLYGHVHDTASPDHSGQSKAAHPPRGLALGPVLSTDIYLFVVFLGGVCTPDDRSYSESVLPDQGLRPSRPWGTESVPSLQGELTPRSSSAAGGRCSPGRSLQGNPQLTLSVGLPGVCVWLRPFLKSDLMGKSSSSNFMRLSFQICY